MSRTIVIVLFVVALVAASFPAVMMQCPPNEEFNSCGSACEPTCTHQPEVCTMQCISGCQCKPGYVRSASNACILPKDC